MHIKSGSTYDSNLEFFAQQHLVSLGYEIIARDKTLPGKPDVVLQKERVAVLVHGCFFHAHDTACRDTHLPVNRRAFWEKKFARTKERDRLAIEALQALGYRVAVVWGCALRHAPAAYLRAAMKSFIEGDLPFQEFDNFNVTWLFSAASRKGSAAK